MSSLGDREIAGELARQAMASELGHDAFSLLRVEGLENEKGRLVTSRAPVHEVRAVFDVAGRREARRYILKVMRLEDDLLARLTNDHRCRETRLFEEGVLARLPYCWASPARATHHQDDTHYLLMDDVSEALCRRPVPREVSLRLVRCLAHLHHAFWESPVLGRPELGLTSVDDYVWLWVAPEERPDTRQDVLGHPFFSNIPRWWHEFRERHLDAKTRPLLHELLERRRELVEALASLPRTLTHGDFMLTNLGRRVWEGREQWLVLDWGLAGACPASLDLAWFLRASHNVDLLTNPAAAGEDELIGAYREELASLRGADWDEEDWRRAWALTTVYSVVFLGRYFASNERFLGPADEAPRRRQRGWARLWVRQAWDAAAQYL